MKIQIHGGSTIVVPVIEGIKKSTQLMVQKTPGKSTAEHVWTLEDYNNQFLADEHLFDFDEEPPTDGENCRVDDILPSW